MGKPISIKVFVADSVTDKTYEISVINGVVQAKEYTETPQEKTELQELIDVESKEYLKRLSDGQKAVRDMMSELRLNSIQNNLDRSVNKAIEDAFKSVSDALSIYGWWVTAKEELDLVVVDGVIVTQEFWDRINATITTYIANNY